MGALVTPERIKVLEVINTLGLGGTEKVAQMLAMHLNKDLFCVSVCGLLDGGARASVLESAGLETKVVHNDSPELTRYLKERKFDLIHWNNSGEPEPFLLSCVSESGCRPAIIRTNVFGHRDDSGEARMVDMNIFISKFCYLRYCKKYRCDTPEFYKANKVIYNPVDLEQIEAARPNSEEKARLKIQYGIPADAPVIGRIGRPDDSKFGSICIEMMPYLLKQQPDVKFVIVGMTQKKMKRIKELGLLKSFVIIEPTADTKKIYSIYHIMDVYAHSATWGESFGCTIAEAMACGKSVVTHATPFWDNAQIELVDNGKTGFVANFPRLYAQAVDLLLRKPKLALLMGEAGRQKAKALYDIKVIARQTEKLYLEALQDKHVVLSPALIDYLKTGCAPYVTIQELNGFCEEYKRRLSKSFGRPVLTERLQLFGNNVIDTLRVIKARVI
jgi:glycosyltransferase involved in cell wall biosynthesis